MGVNSITLQELNPVQKDFYHILGVPRSASQEEMQQAFRKGARTFHPDVSSEPNAEERFKLINEAYSVLSDPEKRALYDRYGENWEQAEQFDSASGSQDSFRHHSDFYEERNRTSQGSYFYHGSGAEMGSDYEEILRDLFGGGYSQQRHSSAYHRYSGRSIHADLDLTLAELTGAGTKTISYTIDSLASSGQIEPQARTIEVKIPQGVTNGSVIRLKGQGEPGMGDGLPGDLLLKIRIKPDNRFQLDGHDLLAETPVTPWEAALGTKLQIQTLDGVVRLKIPSGSQSGRRFRLKGKGLPKKQGRGDLYVKVKIVIPESLSEEEERLFKELSRSSEFSPRGDSRTTDYYEEAA